jgi:hypothetical protein
MPALRYGKQIGSPKYPAGTFFGNSCRDELLSPWHTHFDNYGNYMTGFWGGISFSKPASLKSFFRKSFTPILKSKLSSTNFSEME